MARTIRTTLKPVHASGNRTSWFKLVEKVDSTIKTGYAFQGEVITTGVEVELPVGGIVIEQEPTGSVKNSGKLGRIYFVTDKPDPIHFASDKPDPDLRNPHLKLISEHNWLKNFLTFRDEVAALLAKKQAKDEAEFNELIESINPMPPEAVTRMKLKKHANGLLVSVTVFNEALSLNTQAVAPTSDFIASLIATIGPEKWLEQLANAHMKMAHDLHLSNNYTVGTTPYNPADLNEGLELEILCGKIINALVAARDSQK